MSQSNATYALKKIQTAFGTDLFIRKGRKLVPSEFGWHVYGRTEKMLEEFRSVKHQATFNPAEEFSLSFGATKYDIAAVFPHIQSLLAHYAPKAKLRLIALDTSNTLGQLAELDFIFVPVDIASTSIRAMEILTDTMVVFFDSDKRDAIKTVAEFAEALHAIAPLDGTNTTFTDHLLVKKGLDRNVVISAYGFAAVAALIANTPVISTMPKRLKNTLFRDFAYCDAPLGADTMSLFMCGETAKEEPGKIRWFTELLKANPMPEPAV